MESSTESKSVISRIIFVKARTIKRRMTEKTRAAPEIMARRYAVEL